MADLGRRRFLAGTGLAAGLVAGCRPGRDPYTPEKPPVPRAPGVRPGTESQVLSTCGLCDAGCGIRVRVVDGRAVKVEGNPASPVNRGGLCARGLAGLELLYHPDRVRGPMLRRGERGANQWESITWDAALGVLRERVSKLQAAGQASGVLLVDGESRGTTHALWTRFMAALGSPNHVGHGATGRAAVAETLRTMTGRAGVPGYDFEGAGCVLLIGTGALESSPQAIHLARALGGTARPRLVCVAPRLPRAAALMDDWFAVEPGRASAVLLGLLHVLFRDHLSDESVIEKARGVGELRAAVMASYSPAQVAALVGVTAARLETLAGELVASRPSIVVVDEESKDATATGAAVVLNALLSGLGVPGGMLLDPDEPAVFSPADERQPAALEARALDGRARAEDSRILAIPDAILADKPYPVEVMLLHYSNPAFSKPSGKQWARAIAKVPFVASFSPILDESVAWADLVLPDQTYLERWDLVAPARGTGVVSLRQPVVAPLTNGMQTGEVILRLAAALGGKVAAALPWKTYREAAVAHLEALSDQTEDVFDHLDEKGVCKLARKDAVDAMDGLTDVRPAIPATAAATVGDPVQFPFVLCPFRDRGYAEGGFRQFPWLAELPGATGDPWPGYVEIAPQDARKIPVEDGAWVAVSSSAGRVELRARIHPHIRPGVLGLRLGGWGRWVGDLDGVPARLLGALADSSGHWLAWGTRAKIERLG